MAILIEKYVAYYKHTILWGYLKDKVCKNKLLYEHSTERQSFSSIQQNFWWDVKNNGEYYNRMIQDEVVVVIFKTLKLRITMIQRYPMSVYCAL